MSLCAGHEFAEVQCLRQTLFSVQEFIISQNDQVMQSRTLESTHEQHKRIYLPALHHGRRSWTEVDGPPGWAALCFLCWRSDHTHLQQTPTNK